VSESLALPDLPRDRRPRLGMAASLGMHAVFALALVWVSPLRPLMVPAPRPVAVDIVTEQQYRAMTAPAAPIAEPAAPPQVSAPAPAAATTPALSKSPASTAKTDRGVVAPGYRADLNVIDFDALSLALPQLVHDLPGGARRLIQRADGYRATFVAGEETMHDGEETGARPGKLVRGAR